MIRLPSRRAALLGRTGLGTSVVINHVVVEEIPPPVVKMVRGVLDASPMGIHGPHYGGEKV